MTDIVSNATPLIAFARQVTGSVGLLIRAKQLGEIKAVQPLLEAMHQAGIYFSQRFIDSVLQYLGEA